MTTPQREWLYALELYALQLYTLELYTSAGQQEAEIIG